ncbi:sigma-70 family RNA polymerase sigma factor [Sphingobacterium sp. SG20118]|uniref:sigma-70 family RNA polymerase sigma factor n=1 Tax=unclassified Sphingobacterium TaxID=2609468 RepID=UPI0004F794F1|nr:sigma-70 family RNA polymerase sigma factor [Sphingobacterium sp. ML3W]AIM37098.1 RNA polymerase sigma factor [Sphingobacterium sp. ML3W]
MTKTEFNMKVIEQTNELKGFALRFTNDHDEVNDLLQDTMLKAVSYFRNFQEGSNLKAWLYTIMRNTFINNYRRVTKSRSFITTEDEIGPANLYFSSVSNGGEEKFISEDIQNALNELDEGFYVPFTMLFEGYKYNEIAEHLNIPIGTVKTRIHIARKKLKGSLANYKN